MRLHIGDLASGNAAERLQCPDLIQNVVPQLVRVIVDAPPPEAGQISIAHLGPDGHAALDGVAADAVHRGRVAGVEAARHVG